MAVVAVADELFDIFEHGGPPVPLIELVEGVAFACVVMNPIGMIGFNDPGE